MRQIALCVVVLLMTVGGLITVRGSASASPTSVPAQSHAEWLSDVLKQISSIPHGTSRADFEKKFVMDGGINGVSPQRYCYRDAPCIKVDASFETPAESKEPFSDPRAVLTHLSRPYLEYPFAD
jgi:hypothetical protein